MDSKVVLGWGGGWVVTGQVQGHLGTWHGISRGLTGVSIAQQDRTEPQAMETPPKCGVPEGCWVLADPYLRPSPLWMTLSREGPTYII